LDEKVDPKVFILTFSVNEVLSALCDADNIYIGYKTVFTQ